MARTRNRQRGSRGRRRVEPERLALLGHAKQRGPIQLADGREAWLTFVQPHGHTCRVAFASGNQATVPISTITIVEDQGRTAA